MRFYHIQTGVIFLSFQIQIQWIIRFLTLREGGQNYQNCETPYVRPLGSKTVGRVSVGALADRSTLRRCYAVNLARFKLMRRRRMCLEMASIGREWRKHVGLINTLRLLYLCPFAAPLPASSGSAWNVQNLE